MTDRNRQLPGRATTIDVLSRHLCRITSLATFCDHKKQNPSVEQAVTGS